MHIYRAAAAPMGHGRSRQLLLQHRLSVQQEKKEALGYLWLCSIMPGDAGSAQHQVAGACAGVHSGVWQQSAAAVPCAPLPCAAVNSTWPLARNKRLWGLECGHAVYIRFTAVAVPHLLVAIPQLHLRLLSYYVALSGGSSQQEKRC